MENIKSWLFISPELSLIAFSFIILISGLFVQRKALLGIGALVAVAAAVYNFDFNTGAGKLFFDGLLINDSFSVYFRLLTLFITAFLIVFSIGGKPAEDEDGAEYYFFLLNLAAAMMLAVSANNLMMIYLAIETVSVLSYILVGYIKNDIYSSEAGVKYFLYGTFSTGIMLYGISLIYGLFGSLDFPIIYNVLGSQGCDQPALLLALSLIFVGLGFKCAVFPFQTWVADVYQGAPTPVTALLSVGPKAMGFAVLIRVFLLNFVPYPGIALEVLIWIAVLTMTVGNFIAISQTNIKRLLAYSSIAQAGYILLAFISGSEQGVQAMMFYLFVYSIMNLGAFGCVILVSRAINSDAINSDLVEDYSGLYKRAPFIALVLTVSLLSLAGIPPLAGFFGKFLILAEAIKQGFVVMAVLMLLNSVVALSYYIRIIKVMYLGEQRAGLIKNKSYAISFALLLTVLGNLIFGIWPQPFLDWLKHF